MVSPETNTTPRGKATTTSLVREVGALTEALNDERNRSAALMERIARMEVAAHAQQTTHERRMAEEDRRRRVVELELESVRGQLSRKIEEFKVASVSLKNAQASVKRAEGALDRATQAHEAATARAVAHAEEGARAVQQRWVVLHGELTAMAERVEAGEETIRQLTKLLEAEKRGRARTVEAADRAEEKRRAAVAKKQEEREQKRYVHQRLTARVHELEKETKTLRAQLKAAEEAAKTAPVVVPIVPVAQPAQCDAPPRHLIVIGRSLKNGNEQVLTAARTLAETDSELARLMRQLARLADVEEGSPDSLVARRAIRGALGAK